MCVFLFRSPRVLKMTREREKETRKRRDEKIISSLHFFANKHPKKGQSFGICFFFFFFFFFAKHKHKKVEKLRSFKNIYGCMDLESEGEEEDEAGQEREREQRLQQQRRRVFVAVCFEIEEESGNIIIIIIIIIIIRMMMMKMRANWKNVFSMLQFNGREDGWSCTSGGR